jgi:Protein of unknown function DUF262
MTANDDETWMGKSDESEIRISEYDIAASSNDFNVMTIVSFIDEGAIKLPPYQRNYTWDRKRASKLIESLIIGLPVPQVFLYEEGKNNFSILDGQQRLMSIYFFWKQRFPRKDKRVELRDIFTTEGMYPATILGDDKYFEKFSLDLPSEDDENRSPLHGLNYATLGDSTSTFKLRPIRSVIIKQNEPKDDNSSVYEMFDRLNTGGINLKPQQIRSNLYHSNFYTKLAELNKHPTWRKLLANAAPDADLRDVELILRAFGMLCYADQYRPSMTRFLNRFSRETKKVYDKGTVEFLAKLFEEFLEKIKDIDISDFRLSSKFSIAMFEAAFVGSCTDAWRARDIALIKNVTSEIMSKLGVRLQSLQQEGTSKKDSVVKRLAVAVSVFE